MHPTYDPEGLTDEQLLDKITKLHNYLSREVNYGHDSMVQNIHVMLDTLEAEKEQRMVTAQQEELRKKGIDITETIEVGVIADFTDNNKNKG